jgi:hypothetical protein
MNNIKYVGWASQNNINEVEMYDHIFNDGNYKFLQGKCTEILKRNFPSETIIVPINTIKSVLDSVFQSHMPKMGDANSRYILNLDSARNDVRDIIDRTINIITTQITNEYETERQNKKLTIWTTVLGDFNAHGLRSHSAIKLNRRRPKGMQFHMKY